MNRRLLLTLGTILTAALALGFSGDNTPQPAPPPAKLRLSTQADAVRLALAHVKLALAKDALPAIRIEDPRCVRFLWVQDGNQLDGQAGDLAVHMLSDRSLPYRMPRIAGGYLLRLEVKRYANGHVSQDRWLKTLEDFRFDPAFNRLLVGGSFLIAEHELLEVEVIREGESHRVAAKELAKGEVGRTDHPGVPQAEWNELKRLLHTEAPIISLPYFVVRSMTSIQDQFGSAEVYGGRYYQFTGIGDDAEFVKFIGLGDGGDLTAFYDRMPSERRVAMWKSRVTGKERRVVVVPAEALTSGSWRAVTFDPNDGNAGKTAFSAMRNLVALQADAREGITRMTMGLDWYDLQNGQGARQDEAPSNVVVSDMVRDRFGNRNPHSARLQPAIKCIECHMAGGDDGWLPLHNDVLTFMRSGFYPLTDLDLRGRSFDDVRITLEQKYQGEPEKLVYRARDDLAEAVLRCTGEWPGGDGSTPEQPIGTQKDVVKLAAGHLVKVFNRHVYEPVDARDALRALGVEPPKELGVQQKDGSWTGAVGLLRAIVPPRPIGAVEDPAIKALHLGMAVNRFDADVALAFMAERLKR